jgi:hypothetical protein
MALEAALINCTWVIITLLHVPFKFFICKQFMLMCEDLLVSGTKITHLLMVYTPDMPM